MHRLFRTLSGAALIVLLGAALAPAPSRAADKTTLIALIASNAKAAYTEMIAAFEKAHPGVTVEAQYLGGSTIGSKVDGGEPADVILAGSTVVDKIANSVTDVTPILRNKEVILVPKDNPAHITSLKDLANPGVKLSLGTPSSAVGGLTGQVVQKAAADYGFEFVQKFRANIAVQNEKGSDVVAAVGKDANATIAFVSDEDPAKFTAIQIDDKYNVVSTYVMAIPKQSKNVALDKAMIQLAASGAGQAILRKHNYMAPH